MKIIRGLLMRVLLLTAFFMVCHLAGLRAYTSVLCGMQAGGLTAVFGAVYIVAYLGFVVVAPIFLIAALLLVGAGQVQKKFQRLEKTS